MWKQDFNLRCLVGLSDNKSKFLADFPWWRQTHTEVHGSLQSCALLLKRTGWRQTLASHKVNDDWQPDWAIEKQLKANVEGCTSLTFKWGVEGWGEVHLSFCHLGFKSVFPAFKSEHQWYWRIHLETNSLKNMSYISRALHNTNYFSVVDMQQTLYEKQVVFHLCRCCMSTWHTAALVHTA